MSEVALIKFYSPGFVFSNYVKTSPDKLLTLTYFAGQSSLSLFLSILTSFKKLACQPKLFRA
jgi:hypothetical protein